MAETAGSITVQIGGDITAFEAALAKAKQQAVAFDAQISAQLNGGGVSAGLEKIAAGVEQTNLLLTKLTTSGASAGAALTKVAASTKATTAALTEVAAATKVVNAEMASIGGSAGGAAALTTGTIAAKDFAAALEATGGNLSKITPGMLGLAVANEEVATTAKVATTSMAALGVAETETAGLGAGVSREFSVLGSEVLRGNFSRIPGSLLVMNERLAGTGASVLTLSNGMKALGALGNVIFNPFVLGFLAISVGLELATKAFGSFGGGISEVNQVLEDHKKLVDEIAAAYPEAAKAAKDFEEQAKLIPKSVAEADIHDQVKANADALKATLGELSIQMKMLSTEWGLVGSAGAEAFAKIADIANSGTADAASQVQNELGKLRMDPKLSQNAKDFAKDLQDDANAAVKLQAALNEKSAVNNIVVNDAKAKQTLFDLSSGFKDVGAKAGDASAVIAKLFGTMNSAGGGSGGFGVTRSLGAQLSGQLQTTLGMFQTVDQAVQQSRQNQLAGMMELDTQFRATTTDADKLVNALLSVGDKNNLQKFFGDTNDIANASSEIERATSTVVKLFDALNHGSTSVNAVHDGLEMVRQALINDGFNTEKVDLFIQRLIQTKMQLDNDVSGAKQLNSAIQAIKDKTVTITVVTQQVGTGTKSIYDVGTTGGIGVTRYGGQSDMTQQSYQVPATGGSDSSVGSTGVTVTRFGGTRAAGGPVGANTPYWVGEHGPELVVPTSAGSVVPNGQSTALANAQSGFTGTQATKENDRYWVVLMNIEAATRKTAQLLDEIKAAGASFASSGSGSSSSSASSAGSSDSSAYAQILKQVKANFAAAGIVGGGSIGYGGQGLAATPEQIARAIVNGTASSVGSVGANDYENTLTQTQISMQQQEARRHKAIYGFAPGGMIGGDGGDTQKVEFFKNPNEKVIIARPDQFADVRPGTSSTGSAGTADSRPISITMHNNWNGNAQPSKDSLAAIRQQTALGIRDALRSVNGR